MRNCDAMKTGKILLCRRIILEDERRGFLVEVSWSRIPRLKAVVLVARLIHGNRVAGLGKCASFSDLWWGDFCHEILTPC